MATSLEKLENEVQIHHLHVECFHIGKRLWKSVQYIRRYSTKCASCLAVSYLKFTNKLCQRPLRYWKKNSDLSSTPKTLSYGVKIAKITHDVYFSYDTKSVAMATSLEESEKTGPVWQHPHTNTSIWCKNRENQSSRSRYSFAQIKKRKKLRRVKYIAPPASLPSGLKKKKTNRQLCKEINDTN